jgi:hypothetical protein
MMYYACTFPVSPTELCEYFFFTNFVRLNYHRLTCWNLKTSFVGTKKQPFFFVKLSWPNLCTAKQIVASWEILWEVRFHSNKQQFRALDTNSSDRYKIKFS